MCSGDKLCQSNYREKWSEGGKISDKQAGAINTMY